MDPKKSNKKILIKILAFCICGVILYYAWPMFSAKVEYTSIASSVEGEKEASAENKLVDVLNIEEEKVEPAIPLAKNTEVTHIETPDQVKAIYLSAWVAGSAKYREPLVKLVDSTELNSMIIDIKDSTGRISYYTANKEVNDLGAPENRIGDIRALTNALHAKNIYIIGRVSVFQDPYMTKKNPSWAVTKKSDGTVWKDKKGLSFLDPANKEVWDYTLAIAHDAYEAGFDEINFDYIRYPSDGNIKDINYRLAQGETRADNIEEFFIYLSENMKKDKDIPISADLFGLTTEVVDDLGIGQVWEKALPHFDFLAPMVYPSHYPSGYAGYKNPANYPYEVINKAISSAVKKTKAVPGQDIAKIRPWLQDFDMGATYTKEMVRAQIKAVYDNGLDSWMLWDPSNKYTASALLPETE